jgi:putative methionine-R-sulfoxide reductase with GAF domain
MRGASASPPENSSENYDRRRSVRYRFERPAHASLTAITSTQAPAWMKIIDISESGMAILAPFPLAPGQRRATLLNLPESPALIETDADVISTDASGRAGLQFHAMPEESLRALKHWLSSHRVIKQFSERPNIRPLPSGSGRPHASGMATPEDPGMRTQPDYTSLLAAVEAVQPQVEAVGPDRNAALELITRRAQNFTRANGAALALAEGEEMVCRASVDDAPPAGTHFRIGSGFSGECVRSGSPLRCDDSETDPRVDRFSCRCLGIRAILAVPIRTSSAIIGLLEVFSRHPHAFGSEHEFILLRLAKMAAAASVPRGSTPDFPVSSPVVDDDFASDAPPDRSPPRRVPGWLGVLTKVAIIIAFVIFGVNRIWEGDGFGHARTSDAPATAVSIQPLDPENAQLTTGLPELLQLADEGDAAAEFALGVRYEMGSGVPQDDQEALRWFSKAAEQDDPAAQGMLGAYYWAGRGMPADLVKAYFWSILAEAGGDEASKSRVALLASRLNHRQILYAEQQANDWIAQHRTSPRAGGIAEQ